MPAKKALDPQTRTLYGDSLRAPEGYVFDAGVATTYSLDFETALAAPVSLALYAAESRQSVIEQPLALLEGAERIAGRLVIYTDAGQMHAQASPHSRLCALLEKIIVEVVAPSKAAFHPKLWLLRYKPLSPSVPVRMRLLVLSRNLTQDRSWDTCLRLDGDLGNRNEARNRPVHDLLMQLPSLAVSTMDDGNKALTEALARDVRRAHWDLPDGFDEVSFAVTGFGRPWAPEGCAKLGIVSPFCDVPSLKKLSKLSDTPPILISRPDQLACIDDATRGAFSSVRVLDEMAESEDGEETSASRLDGLHAKVYVSEKGWKTTITVGSANATSPALVKGTNVELIVSLTGQRSAVGSVDDVLGSTGFGRLTREYVPQELLAEDALAIEAQRQADDARIAIARAGLRLRCERTSDDQSDVAWRLWLLSDSPLALQDVSRIDAWPITRGEGQARSAIEALRNGGAVDLGAMSLLDVTRFIAFRVRVGTGETEAVFSTTLEIEGLPADRQAAILRWAISSRASFFRYLRLLLSELGDPFAAALAAQQTGAPGKWGASAGDSPLLEDLVRALCRGDDSLRAVERLVARLESIEDENPMPDDFRVLWESFRQVIRSKEISNVE
jgi:hypothetical protein